MAADQAIKLLPVNITEEIDLRKPKSSQVEPAGCRAIHTELPSKVRIRLEDNVDPSVVRAVLKSLRSWFGCPQGRGPGLRRA